MGRYCNLLHAAQKPVKIINIWKKMSTVTFWQKLAESIDTKDRLTEMPNRVLYPYKTIIVAGW